MYIICISSYIILYFIILYLTIFNYMLLYHILLYHIIYTCVYIYIYIYTVYTCVYIGHVNRCHCKRCSAQALRCCNAAVQESPGPEPTAQLEQGASQTSE